MPHIRITHQCRGDDETPQGVIGGLGVEFATKGRAADDGPADVSRYEEEKNEVAVSAVDDDGSAANTGKELKDGKEAAEDGEVDVKEEVGFIQRPAVPVPLAGNSFGSYIARAHHERAGETESKEGTSEYTE